MNTFKKVLLAVLVMAPGGVMAADKPADVKPAPAAEVGTLAPEVKALQDFLETLELPPVIATQFAAGAFDGLVGLSHAAQCKAVMDLFIAKIVELKSDLAGGHGEAASTAFGAWWMGHYRHDGEADGSKILAPLFLRALEVPLTGDERAIIKTHFSDLDNIDEVSVPRFYAIARGIQAFKAAGVAITPAALGEIRLRVAEHIGTNDEMAGDGLWGNDIDWNTCPSLAGAGSGSGGAGAKSGS